jgi:hypothetical protein
MSDPDGSTFIDIPKLFTDSRYAKQKLQHVTDPTVREFWEGEMAKTSDYHKSEMLGWFVSKFGAFMSNEMMRNIIGQTKSSVNLREVMDEGKILLVNLSKGRTGELNSKLLGMLFVMKFQAAAMSRASIPEEHRRDFSLYVDEFQNFSTDSFATILSEARKYHLNLIVANQFITQLSEEIRDSVFGNVGSIVGLRVGANDADFLTKQFSPTFDTEDLVKLPNFNAIVRLMIGGVPSQPFTMATIPSLGHPNPRLGQALKRLSAAKYGRTRSMVEKEIFSRLETKPEPPRSTGIGGGLGLSPASTQLSGGSSFLDEWLAKRKAQSKSAVSDKSQHQELDSETAIPGAVQSSADRVEPTEPVKKPSLKSAQNSNLADKSESSVLTEDEVSDESPIPTDFAKAKASGQIQFEESELAGSKKDKNDVADLADLARKQLEFQSDAQAGLADDNPAGGLEDSSLTGDDDGNIYIDEFGKIHQKDTKAKFNDA